MWFIIRENKTKTRSEFVCDSQTGDWLLFPSEAEANRACKMYNYLYPQWVHTAGRWM